MKKKDWINGDISVIYRYGQQFFVERLTQYGCQMKTGQMPSLLEIWAHPGVTQEGICRGVGMDKGTTARAVKSLEEVGLITREQDPEDRRANRLSLTPAGEEMVPLLFRATDEYHDWLLRGFSPAERRQLALFLERLRQNVQEQPLPDDPYPAG